jgi:hypothetical protein
MDDFARLARTIYKALREDTISRMVREAKERLARSNGTRTGIAHVRIRQHAAIYWKRRELEQK